MLGSDNIDARRLLLDLWQSKLALRSQSILVAVADKQWAFCANTPSSNQAATVMPYPTA